jgi:hypothetical protein
VEVQRDLQSVHWIGCQIPQTHIMLSPSQVPEPQVVQGAAQAVPTRGRAAGQPAAAGAAQLSRPAAQLQLPSG